MTDVISLDKAIDTKLVGGKASALSRLIRSGFNVPAGFVVVASDRSTLDAALAEFDKLGAKKVAVRSSAAAEDGAKDAWAGQLDTFLNVTREDLREKILACFESATSDRAKAYAKQKNISPGSVAAIVQKMVPAQISGVAFSAHPVSNDHDQMVIESVQGLGEKLVSGSVTPDTYVIGKKTGEVVNEHLSAEVQNLSSQQIKELSKTITKIEDLFGFPVDVEWAYAAGELFILQSRPITTLG